MVKKGEYLISKWILFPSKWNIINIHCLSLSKITRITYLKINKSILQKKKSLYYCIVRNVLLSRKWCFFLLLLLSLVRNLKLSILLQLSCCFFIIIYSITESKKALWYTTVSLFPVFNSVYLSAALIIKMVFYYEFHEWI